MINFELHIDRHINSDVGASTVAEKKMIVKPIFL